MSRKELTFRVFVSSTFSDLKAERDALQNGPFNSLRDYCRLKGASFQAIDLRWGVSQEASLDQQTVNICQQELVRCQELSPRPNFIVILGERYGWRPLPPQVKAMEFENLRDAMSDEERMRVDCWYRRDDNAVPAEYCLQHREGEFADHDRWAEEEIALHDILAKAATQVLPPDDPELPKYFESATHQEIRHGALTAEDPQSHVFCYFRKIVGLPEDASAAEYRDLKADGSLDEDAQQRLKNLKAELKDLLPEEHVHEDYTAIWTGKGADWALAELCHDLETDLRRIIDEELDAFELQPALERTVRDHRDFARSRSQHFKGRGEELERIKAYLACDSDHPLVVFGESGSGKTALMAQAWREHVNDGSDPDDDVAPLLQSDAIARFIGATPASSDLRSLLTDICQQLGITSPPNDMNELIVNFKWLVSEEGAQPKPQGEPNKEGVSQTADPQPAAERKPVILFLDALDQLNATENARMLYWLPRKLAPGVRVVLSVLKTETDSDANPSSRQHDPYHMARRIWGAPAVEVGPWTTHAAEDVLALWLGDAGRTLACEQRQHVLDRFSHCRLPLYLKLAFEETRRWKSWEGVPVVGGLKADVNTILNQLFERLCDKRQHGKVLTRYALSYLATGKNGLTEYELLDVLSDDKHDVDGNIVEAGTVMSSFRKRNPESPPVDRLPVVIWSRLYADLQPYMTQRKADGTVVMSFYHRQVGQAVRRKFLSDELIRRDTHKHLAEYFNNLDYFGESLDDQRARAMRIPYSARLVNIRKVVELPYHLLEAAKLGPDKDDPNSPYWDAAANLLSDWQFIEAKNEVPPS